VARGSPSLRVAVVLLTRDLRVHDHPALAAASEAADEVVPLFVFDRAVLKRFGAPNRVAFLLDSLRDLAASLRERGGALFVREGDVVAEAMRVAAEAKAEAIFVSDDVSAYAQARELRLAEACEQHGIELHVMPGVTVIPPGAVAPDGGDAYKVFTPYWRRWSETPRRALARTPRAVTVPGALARGHLPALADLARGDVSPELPAGGESEGAKRVKAWLASGVGRYDERHDDLAADGTSRISAHLHFGCLSPLAVAERAREHAGAAPFVRQLCWRDFYAQLLGSRPDTPREDFRSRGDRWRDDEAGLTAWKEGRTGFPIIDAGMRQLAREGFMHNRARLLTASFLTKDLAIDWREGAAHFFGLLVDGDLANNVGNWQWVAGTGVDTRPNRVFNPITQAKRFDPEGEYVRRYVPELEGIEGGAVHEPWKLERPPKDYPEPILDHREAVARLRAMHETRDR
jgi:deoxyribodipyrimidine photo-lyase